MHPAPHAALSRQMPAHYYVRALVCLALCLVLAACGFRLKGVAPLPFSTVYTNIDGNSAFGAHLRRSLQASSPGLQFVDDPLRAQVHLTQLASNQNLRDVSLDAQGRVEEYELTLEFVFQVTDTQGRSILQPTTLRTTRELPYDDTIVQAKQGEIEVTFESMRQSLVERILYIMSSPDVTETYRRLAADPDDTAQEQVAPAAPRSSATPSRAPTAPRTWGAPEPQISPSPRGF